MGTIAKHTVTQQTWSKRKLHSGLQRAKTNNKAPAAIASFAVSFSEIMTTTAAKVNTPHIVARTIVSAVVPRIASSVAQIYSGTGATLRVRSTGRMETSCPSFQKK